MPERVCLFQEQCYDQLKRACLRRGVLFQDPHFPPSAQSLFYRRHLPPGLTWKRPREICKDPRLFVDGISSRDLHQGSLGNCWMVAATSCLATEPSLWKKVIPNHKEQEWNPKRTDLYAGIFHFRFWRLGRWTDVVIDDRLPTDQGGALLFCRSGSPREFWSALLEKAYAKINGCYEALEGGNTAEALVDFTGGVSEPISLDREVLRHHPDQRRALFQTLARAHARKALITCYIRPAEGEMVESVLDCGLVRGHAYGITAIRKMRVKEQLLGVSGASRIHMVRMRNPWGTADWNGVWSQGVEFEDFCHYFTDVVVCQLAERALLWPRSHWREVRCPGEWAPGPGKPPADVPCLSGLSQQERVLRSLPIEKRTGPKGDRKEDRLGKRQRDGTPFGQRDKVSGGKGGEKITRKEELQNNLSDGLRGLKWDGLVDKSSRCGGCINHRDTFLYNPQFMFEVQGKGDEVLICLQQEDRRIRRRDGGGENLPIGFEVLRVEVNRMARVHCVGEQAASSVYMDSRSVVLRVTLAPGRYTLLPTTFQPGSMGRFLLRVFSHSQVHLRELKEDLPTPSIWQCCLPQPCMVTTVHLRRASGLGQPKKSAPDVYAVIRCEEDTIRTQVFKRDNSPEFNTKTIFYRRRPDTHITIELWSCGWLWDTLLGEARLQTGDIERGRSRVVDLQRGQSRSASRGCIYVDTSSSPCLTDL